MFSKSKTLLWQNKIKSFKILLQTYTCTHKEDAAVEQEKKKKKKKIQGLKGGSICC